MDILENQVMALAGVVQSAHLAKQIAYEGKVSQEELSNCLKGVFVLEPTSVQEIVGAPKNLKASLHILFDIFSRLTGIFNNDEIMQYVLSMTRLERQLAEQNEMLDSIQSALEPRSRAQQEELLIDDAVIHELAGIYRQTISKLPGKFQVSGDAHLLQSPYITVKIRALLFAGIRYTVLWHQLGGRRRQFILQRRQILRAINRLLEMSDTVAH